MKRVYLLWVVLLGLVCSTLQAQIAVRLKLPAKTTYQVLAKNYILKELFALDDIVLVETDEQFQLDVLLKELLSSNNEVVGLSIAAYLMYRINWDGVRDRLIEEKKIASEETTLFEKLPSAVYFPLLFLSDYCTVDGLREACVSFVDVFNREHFDKLREKRRLQEKPPQKAVE